MDEGTTQHLPRVGAPQRIGRVLGARYLLYDDVGGGHLGHVYGAWDSQISHRVAVKILDSRFLDHHQVAQAFEDQGRRAANLPAHRGIVSVHDVQREGRVPYMVREYAPGQNVRSLLTKEAPVSVDHAFDICRQVAQALDFAHQHGVVHGNIKPENILVSRDGRAKVMDFGLGHVMDVAEAVGVLPPLERAPYIAPEQSLGRQPDPVSDVYALGVVLFEMLTGRLPSQSGAVSSLRARHTGGSPGDPRRLHPAIPPAAWRIVLRALARSPGARYRSARAFAAALQRYLLLEGDVAAQNPPGPRIDGDIKRSGGALPVEATASEASGTQLPWRGDPAAHRPRRLTIMSLVFAATLVLALVAGWLAYRTLWDLLNRWDQSPHAHAGWTVKHPPPAHLAALTRPNIALSPGTFRDVRFPTVPGSDCRSYRASSGVQLAVFVALVPLCPGEQIIAGVRADPCDEMGLPCGSERNRMALNS